MEWPPICDACDEPLTEPGALLFGPPEGDIVRKFHLCVKCFLKLASGVGVRIKNLARPKETP